MTPRKPPASIPLLARLVDPRLHGAACTGRAPWWDESIDGETPEDRRDRHDAARRICRGCPVQGACHDAATEHDATGLWAGMIHNPAGMPGRPKKEIA